MQPLEVEKFTSAVVYFNAGTPSGPDHIKSMVQFCSGTGRHTFRYTCRFLILPFQEGLH
jgi:hypothetical protein